MTQSKKPVAAKAVDSSQPDSLAKVDNVEQVVAENQRQLQAAQESAQQSVTRAVLKPPAKRQPVAKKTSAKAAVQADIPPVVAGQTEPATPAVSGEVPAKTDKAAKPVKSAKTPAGKTEKVAKAAKSDKPAKAGKSEKAEKHEKAAKPAKPEKVEKPRKPKLVRDSYAMPELEYALIGELKKRLHVLGAPAKKSELLRGGIAALAALNDAELKAIMSRVERIKTGRPAK